MPRLRYAVKAFCKPLNLSYLWKETGVPHAQAVPWEIQNLGDSYEILEFRFSADDCVTKGSSVRRVSLWSEDHDGSNELVEASN